jgi:hypothetical protein
MVICSRSWYTGGKKMMDQREVQVSKVQDIAIDITAYDVTDV